MEKKEEHIRDAAATKRSPRPPTNRIEPGTDRQSNDRHSGAHVLVVEDTPSNQMLMTRVLQQNHYRVTIAENGAEAVRLFASHNFDLILMDLQMPVMDGFEAALQIRRRELETGRGVPILAVTALVDAETEMHCLTCGMDGVVAKPIDIGELLGQVERCCSRRRLA